MKAELARLRLALRRVQGELDAGVTRLDARIRAAEPRARRAGAGAAVATLDRLSGAVRTGAAPLAERLRSADAALAAVEARLEELRSELERALAALQEDVLASLDAARAPLAHAVDATRSTLEVVQGQVGALTGAATQAVGALAGQVATLRDTGDALAAKLESALATGLAGIAAVPVDALPPMLAQRARDAVTQAGAAAGKALGSASSAAQAQLEPVARQLTEVIDRARTEAGSRLVDGKAALLSRIRDARQAVERARPEIEDRLEGVLGGLQAALARHEQGAKAAVEGIAGPPLAAAREAEEEVGAAVAALVQRSEAELAEIERRLA